ncbi:AMP-binding protein [Profundibacterium mesophilum]|uniref:3-methylmercaptopropionyl-CoA ligase n=1 Tax=Profundibacterium mesophilum KAUST100406-0324 TaxID=1037889 RepID=A0A921NSJ2_9RHOB|nr:AMP-binding protein [Profundibacterium mesophilum]KAF0677195.1 phenylacetate-CoA ligase [Profundibacterium mesophilum KAUST100406-0324]
MFDDPHLAPRAANFRPLTPIDFLTRSLEQHPDRPAVAWREHRWSYAEFGAIVARMAGWLRDQGIGPGDVVSVMLSNRPEMLAAHFAAPAIGAVLNTLNTRLAPDDLHYIVTHAGARIVLCEPGAAGALDGSGIAGAELCREPGAGEGLDFFSGPVPPLDIRMPASETQAIALNYTSGTTGRPKGVVLTHRGATMNALGNVLALGLTRISSYLWTLPMFHCNGWCHTWAVTAAGGMHVCLDKVEPAPILDLIARHEVSHMCCAPVVLYMILDHGGPAAAHPVLVVTGGAAPTPTLLEGMEARGFELIHAYGMTECYGPSTFNDPGPAAPGSVEERAAGLSRQGLRHLTVGGVRVVGEDGRDVPADGESIGEITMSGNTVMAGYYRDPEASEAVFSGGALHSGDLAVMHADGQIEIRDRMKDVIISGGENISSLEVETVLHRHPEVLLAAVVAAPDPKWGETPCAFVEIRSGSALDATGLEAFCKEHLTGFKRPRRFVFGVLPRTATGKIQKFALRQRARDEASS